MADDAEVKLPPEEDEEEFIILETPPEEEGKPAPSGDADERLAESQEDTDAEAVDGESIEQKRARRREEKRQRRERRRTAEASDKQRIAFLEERLAQQDQRISQLTGTQLNSVEAGLDERITAKEGEIAHFEAILAAAVEAKNGQDVTAALRYRDEARDELNSLKANKAEFTNWRNNPPPQQVDQRLASFARDWHNANPWYNPTGDDEDSLIARAVSTSLVKEGYDPRTREHWAELTERLRERFGEDDDEPPVRRAPRSNNGSPPVGVNRGDNVNPKNKNGREVYISPDRIAAIKEMGAWDDPVERNKMIKYYQTWDKENPPSARN